MAHILGRTGRRLAALVFALAGCGGPGGEAAVPAAGLVHLADALQGARVVAAAPDAGRVPRRFDFSEPQPDWAAHGREQSQRLARVELQPRADGLHVALRRVEDGGGMLMGGLLARVDAGPRSAWSAVRVRARSHERLSGVAVAVNVDGERGLPGRWTFMMGGEGSAPVFGDGSVQDYLLPLPPGEPGEELATLGVFLGAPGEGGLDLLAVTLEPRGVEFERAAGVRAVLRGGESRHALYAHAPAELAFPLRVPAGGRLDLGLAGLAGESLRHVVSVRADGRRTVLLDEALEGAEAWAQRAVDLGSFAGRDVELVLEAQGAPGAVALWGAPIVSGTGRDARPNVLFYVIDGAGADQMSLYGYERPTTPFLEELAREAVVFERAHASATWTQPSTASFMTGLHHSVLGGLRRGLHSTPVPDAAVTMAEHFRRGGWFTTSLTTNPNCARVIGLQRGVDVLDDDFDVDHATSSHALHARLLELRRQYPGGPWWAHLQTTDVHEPNDPVEPFAGRWVPAGLRALLEDWEDLLRDAVPGLWGTTSIARFYDTALAAAGLDRHAFYDGRRGLYDETMAQQDASLRRFVQELKDAGEWERTLLVIASDHGHPAGTFARWGRGLIEPPPDEWQGALFDSYSTRVPLLVTGPGLARGLRVSQPVSMVDLLPTLLELCGLPPADAGQGRSLAAALRGAPLPPAPVLLDEVRVDEASGALVGNLEVIDGRWGASLEVGPGDPSRGRHAVPAGGRWAAVHPWFPDVPRLLLYDLQADPFATRAVNDRHPELVERYRRLLEERWQAHLALSRRYAAAGGEALTPDQLESLRALGYIR